VRDIGLRDLKHSVVSLAKAAQALDLPTVATTTVAARGSVLVTI
jgi:hypothetical protein